MHIERFWENIRKKEVSDHMITRVKEIYETTEGKQMKHNVVVKL